MSILPLIGSALQVACRSNLTSERQFTKNCSRKLSSLGPLPCAIAGGTSRGVLLDPLGDRFEGGRRKSFLDFSVFRHAAWPTGLKQMVQVRKLPHHEVLVAPRMKRFFEF